MLFIFVPLERTWADFSSVVYKLTEKNLIMQYCLGTHVDYFEKKKTLTHISSGKFVLKYQEYYFMYEPDVFKSIPYYASTIVTLIYKFNKIKYLI